MKQNLNQIKIVNKDINKIEIELSQANSNIQNHETKIEGIYERHTGLRKNMDELEQRV